MRASLALQALLAGAESGLNRLLRLDPVALSAVARLHGSVIAVQCTAPELEVFILPASDGLHLAAHYEGPVECRLSAPAGALFRLATESDKISVLHEPQVTIEGDSGPLIALSNILQDLDLDWEHEVSRWAGPLGAGLLARIVGSQRSWSQRSAESLHRDVADYLTEESRTLVGRNEAEARFSEIDSMTLKLDRLTARIEQLARNIRERSESA
jgi:ubiquinone biosynthesis protein UbiJ